MDTTEPEGDEPLIVCPNCGKRVDPGLTLWLLLGKWYCSEGCVRVAVRKGGHVGGT